MHFQQTTVREALTEGMARFSHEYPHLSNDEFNAIQDYVTLDFFPKLESVLQAWPSECEDRFVRYFTESLTIASAVRKHQKEPSLTTDDFLCAIGFFSWLLNSFKHR